MSAAPATGKDMDFGFRNTAQQSPSVAEGAYDYGGITDYGYGDETPALEYGYGDSVAPESAKREKLPNNNKASTTSQQNYHNNKKKGSTPASGLDGLLDAEAPSSPVKKRGRGRRLSMFAFAGQDDEMEKFTENSAQNSSARKPRQRPATGDESRSSKDGSYKHAPAFGTGGGVRRALNDESQASTQNRPGGVGMLTSFFSGGGGLSFGSGQPSGAAAAAADNKPAKPRKGRRLSMIAFAGGEPAGSDEGDTPAAPTNRPNNLTRRPSLKRIGGNVAANIQVPMEFLADIRRRVSGSMDQVVAGSSRAVTSSSKYSSVQLPKEFLADMSVNRPTTSKTGTSVQLPKEFLEDMASSRPLSMKVGAAAGPSSSSSYDGAPLPLATSSMHSATHQGKPTFKSAMSQQQPTSSKQEPTLTQQQSSSAQQQPPQPTGRLLSPERKKKPSVALTQQSSLRVRETSTTTTATTATGTATNLTAKSTLASSRNGTITASAPRLASPEKQRLQPPSSLFKPSSQPPQETAGTNEGQDVTMSNDAAQQRKAPQQVAQQQLFKPKPRLQSQGEWSVAQQELEQDGLTTRGDFNRNDQAFLQQYMEDVVGKSSTHTSGSGSLGGASMLSGTSGSSSVSTPVLLQREAAAITQEYAAAVAAGGAPNYDNMSLLHIMARCCDWDAVYEEVKLSPRDAKVVSEKDGTTALHLAVMSRTNPMMRDGKIGEPAPLNVIEALVEACPEAAIIRCTKKRYTPLCYACLVADANYDMEDCCQIVEILLKHCPHCPFVFTDDGFSALDIHILSYSQLHKHKQEVYSGANASTTVLKALLSKEPSLAVARVYRNKIRGPLELLYRCNIDEFKEAVKEESGEMDEAKREARIARFGSVVSLLSDWWAWKWALMLLKYASISTGQDVTPFNAVQAAARLVGCPLPVLALAVSTFPDQVMDRDPTGDIYNLPLHEVCSWRADMENVAGDPFIATRKFKAIKLLLEQFPEGARMTNNCGETPLQLAVETCTPWHGGLEALVEACPKALKFPRKLRVTDNGLALAVANHTAIDSLATNDSDEPDPLEPLENMFPFLVAAVLGGVSKNKRRPPVSFSDEMAEEHYANLERKSLQAVRAVYGLLRARPEVLQKYRQQVRKSQEQRQRQQRS